ncbi:peptide MFS transporter [Aquimarina brevivitae]|uniref:POT family proton-dependent oligopeptide transporter n=1 Tax=Aquimarina brevivitae TaxID=323412 RepID=A0A4Q7PGG1_9FLAO|nr:peptide MFS transporter [Aquimarina brevivitae]RZS98968.1 POT family proton-dependent oligopeptide transporter [Aquimarina brevivitae]
MDITMWIMIVGWIFVLLWVPFIIFTNKNTHPRALFVLFFAEMWERFSYYGMRALLTLYMAKVLFIDLAQNVAEAKAYGIYGSYTAMVYLFPVLGGLVADKLLGFKKTIIWGGFLMALGHFILALQGIEGLEGNLIFFFTALAFIIVGNGFFKPNISSFLGTFYEMDDPRKDGAFSIFYMGVNIGAFLSTLTCGYVGQQINWHYGFGLAGIGMVVGLIVFYLFSKGSGFEGKGLPPKEVLEGNKKFLGFKPEIGIYIISLLAIPVCAFFLDLDEVMSAILIVTSLVIIGYLIFVSLNNKDKVEGRKLLVVVVLFFFHAVFWALFEQAGGSLTIFTDKNVDRLVGGTEIPASIFQSLNPLFIMLFAPLFSWIWLRLNKAKKEPSTPMKFVLGLTQLALGFAVIVIGAKFFASDDGLVPIAFLAIMYLLHTTGELSLSPVGLSMVTKLSPAKVVGFVMGAWFLSIALANKMAGLIGTLTTSEKVDENTAASVTLDIYTNTYLIWGVAVVGGAALLLLVLVPLLRKWMGGIH